MKVSVSLLQQKDACPEQVELFRETFGDGEVVVTEALCVEHAQKFSWSWAALYLFPKSVRAEYKEKRAPIWVEYNEKHALIWAEYEKKSALIRVESEKNSALIWTAYVKKSALIWAEDKEKHARLFGRLAETI